MPRARLLPALLVAITAPFSLASAQAQQTATAPSAFIGTWAMQIGQRNLFVLSLALAGDTWTGALQRPAKMNTMNNLFANISGQRQDLIVKSRLADGALHFTTRNADSAGDEDDYVMTVTGDRAELAFDNLPPGAALEPFSMVRAANNSAVSTDWEPNRTYIAGDTDTPCAEMQAIFDEDQRLRMPQKIDWSVVNRTDAERRESTRKLLAAGALHTGKDYEEAAFVFQHGSTPQDYLLAHTLAMVAVSKGDSTAIWIAAATLDRYLQNAGQKQIYGTQYLNKQNEPWTQDPYDRTLVSDALRLQLGVPPQNLQQKRLDSYNAQK